MDNPGIALILVALVLIVVGVLLGRRRNELAAQQGIEPSRRRRQPRVVEPPIEVNRPRPRVVSMHVRGEEALVTFDVPFPPDGDEVLADLLVQEAVEVVREKRHTLPIDGVTSVVALSGRGDEPRRVGSHRLETPGTLPPQVNMPSMLDLSSFAPDPLESLSEGSQLEPPEVRAPEVGDDLPPLASEIRLPKAVDMGLRAQGIDPAGMSASELVNGLLQLFGYTITPGRDTGQFLAEKAGSRTFILTDDHRPGDHPEVDEATINRFMADFAMSGCDRGMLVSDKYGPFEVYARERREPRVSFVTRERLQKMVDALALS